MERYEYGELCFTQQGHFWACVALEGGATAEKFERRLVVMNRLGADGWLIDGSVSMPSPPSWATEAIVDAGGGPGFGAAWVHEMRRRRA